MTKFYTGKHDRVFKTIICNEEDKKFLIAILEEIIERKITDVTILRNELPVQNTKTTVKTVDLLVKVQKKYIHIELNTNFNRHIKDRNTIMFFEIMGRKTLRGKKYTAEDEFLHIDLNFITGHKGKEVDEFYIQNSQGEKYCENIQFKIFNIDITNKFWYSKNNLVNEKYKYLAMLDLNLEQLRNLKNGDVVIMDYLEKLEKLNESELFQASITVEQDQMLKYNSILFELNEAKEEINKKDNKLNEVQKELKKQKKQQEEMIKTLYEQNVPLETIAKSTNLTVEEIKQIVDQF